MRVRPERFRTPDGCYEADTCEPLRQAARAGELTLCALARGTYPGRPLPRGRLPEVKSVGYWDAAREQRWGLPWHRNEGIELTFLLRGRLDFGIGGSNYRLSRGALTITRPWQRHRIGRPNVGPSRLAWLILDVGVRRPNQPWTWPPWLVLSPADLDRLTHLLRHCEQPVWRGDREIEGCFERLGEAVATDRDGSSLSRLTLHINELFVCLRELLERREPRLDASLSSSLRTVQLFLDGLSEQAGEAWTLEKMAAQCGLGRSRFAHYCRQTTNLSPMEYLTLCRLRLAQRLLREQPQLGILDVSLRCGFQSAQYFATVFRKQFGCTPSAHRRQVHACSSRNSRGEVPVRSLKSLEK